MSMNPSQHIFLSYARKDGIPTVEKMEQALSRAGFATWRDTRGIDITRDFTTEIESGIKASKAVVVCLTKAALKTEGWVRREIAYALLKKKPIIVARFHDVDPPIAVINNTWLDFFKSWDQHFPQLKFFLTERLADYEAPPLDESLTNDPYRPYLEYLLDRINDYLDATVIRQIDLDLEMTEGAVLHPHEVMQSQPQTKKKRRRSGFDLMYTHKALPQSQLKSLPSQEDESLQQDFASMMQRYGQRVLLLGEPGAGKTITLMAYTRELVNARLSDPQAPLPIMDIIPLWDDETQEPFAEWLAETSSELLTPELAQNAITQGNTILFLDGLDELGAWREPPSEETENAIPDNSDSESEQETEKPKGYDPRLRFFETLEQTLNSNTTGALVTCRVKDYADIGTKIALNGAVTLQPLTEMQMQAYLSELPELWDAIQQDAALKKMVYNPLIMSLFAYAYQDISPEERAELANLTNAGDLRDMIIERYFRERYRAEEMRRLRVVDAEPIPFTIGEMLDSLREIAYQNVLGGWRVEDNVLTLEAIEKVINPVEPFIDLCLTLDYWTYTTDSKSYRFSHLMLRDGLAFPEVLKALQDDNDGIRVRSADALGKLGDFRAMKPLMGIFYDSKQRVRHTVYEVLLKLDNDVKQVIEFLKYSEYGPDDSACLLEPVDLEYLINLLHARDSKVRRNAAFALGHLGDSRAVEPLINLLSDSDLAVCHEAAVGLGYLGDSRAVEPLVSILKYDDIPHGAIVALAQLGEVSVDSLVVLLEDSNDRVRRNAIWALVELGDIGITNILIHLLKDSDNGVRRDTAWALGELGDGGVVEPLVGMLQDISLRVQQAAAKSLDKIGTPEALEAVQKWKESQIK